MSYLSYTFHEDKFMEPWSSSKRHTEPKVTTNYTLYITPSVLLHIYTLSVHNNKNERVF